MSKSPVFGPWQMVRQQPGHWQTTNYNWWGMETTFERVERKSIWEEMQTGSAKRETRVIRSPVRQQRRSRSVYVPAVEDRKHANPA